MNAVQRGKILALSVSIKKLVRCHASDITKHLQALGQKKANTCNRNRKQEINKLNSQA